MTYQYKEGGFGHPSEQYNPDVKLLCNSLRSYSDYVDLVEAIHIYIASCFYRETYTDHVYIYDMVFRGLVSRPLLDFLNAYVSGITNFHILENYPDVSLSSDKSQIVSDALNEASFYYQTIIKYNGSITDQVDFTDAEMQRYLASTTCPTPTFIPEVYEDAGILH